MKQKLKLIEIYGLWFADLVAIFLSFMLATYVRFGNFKDMGDKEIHFQVCLVFLLFCTIYSFFIEWNRNFLKRKIAQELKAVIQYNLIMILVVETIMYFLKWADVFSRLVMVFFVMINIVMSLAVHMAVKKAMKIHYKSDMTKIKVLVITQMDMAQDVLSHLQSDLEINFQIVGISIPSELSEEKEKNAAEIQEVMGIPVNRISDKFWEQATQMALDEVFIYAPALAQNAVKELVDGFDEMGVNSHYCVELQGTQTERSKIDNFGNYSVITYTRFQSSYKRLLIKRVIDIIGGMIGMLITIILFPFVAIAIKLDSPGPALFSQLRIGRNGRRFKIYKFRSMYLDAEQGKKELEKQNEMQGLMFKIENDPRITRVGRFIRKTSIDELPQFYNVLKGDMSLVGTRPPTADEFEKYNQYYRRRISMTPGLTGMWQVSGRSEIDNFDDVVKYDLEYIDHWSLKLDFKILFRTVWVVLAGRGSK